MTGPGAVLIAGCGDVGGRLGAVLAASGVPVYGLRRSETPLPEGVRPLRADLADPATLAGLPRDIRRVVFLPTPGARDEAAYRRTFGEGLRNLVSHLDGAGGVDRLVFVSSSAVYGEHGGAWVDETAVCLPLAFNGAVLLESERWLLRNLPQAVVARCSGIYGPGRTRLVDQVANGTATLPAGEAEFTNRIHVDDVAGALAHLLTVASVQPCYNLSDHAPATLAEVYGFIADQLHLPPLRVGTTAPDRAVGNKRLSNRRLCDSGYVFRHPDYRSGYGALVSAMRR
ncbi:SDR family oxidoreductase [Tahibacter amnicola]|uniref:SDR family oxidoreductase n=1 Tax=Tahibacter amnicola TaxID=2976241 RepID=A0ABY6BIK8_9GAMM|nr:SDR family oxidoreductase [Tahibacter amnicola]UXI69337.1 SDR family oxidoreductase [Tahibacter amnicola]